eukprot:TRINITY_DN9047_c0_g1_i1.p1 TRINITY_DN9047_c0_g1~~TRINITY_DN9047_c0_g1_i1.p1  ORF type:complete len:605 (+),score=113.26 TRINITY_DN9047_c0_g1_i1:85-1899(+)
MTSNSTSSVFPSSTRQPTTNNVTYDSIDGIDGGDIAVVVVYFIVILSIGLLDLWWPKVRAFCYPSWNASSHDETSSDYFLASKEMSWPAVMASLFASNIGSEHFIGLAGSGAASGIAVGGYEWSAGLMLLLLGWVFVPLYLQCNVFTMPEFLKRRFQSQRLQLALTVMSLLLYVFTKISVTLYAGGVVFRLLLGWNLFASAGVLILATGAYTVFGGLRAVVYTEIFQTGTLLLGGLTLMGAGLAKAGGWQGLRDTLPDSYFHLFQPANDEDYPWPGMVFGLQITSLWYWCTDQVIVQRVLCAKTAGHARAGTVAAGFLKLLPMFMMVVPGMIAQALYPEDVSRHGTDAAYPILIVRTLPSGLAGFMLAAMLAALMSSLASVFNSSSTLFAMDVWRTIRTSASEHELVRVGRIVTVVMCVIGLIWIPIIQNGTDQLFVYIQSVSSYLSPPVAVVFVAAVAYKQSSEPAAFWTLIFGLCLGLARLLGEFAGHADKSAFFKLNFLYFALISASLCAGVLFAITWLGQRHRGGATITAMPLTDLDNEQTAAKSESDQAGLLDENTLDNDDSSQENKLSCWSTAKKEPMQAVASAVLIVVIVSLYIGFA